MFDVRRSSFKLFDVGRWMFDVQSLIGSTLDIKSENHKMLDVQNRVPVNNSMNC